MKVRELAVAAGLGAPLILGGMASAGFVGITTTSKPNEFGIFVCNVYATFDRPGEDRMLVVAGTPNSPMQIDVIGGTFYQAPQFDSDRAPNPVHFDAFPSNRYDSFVTIGVKSFNPNDPGNPEGEPEDNLVLYVGWPGFGASTVSTTNSGWFIIPDSAQGDPFDPNFSSGGNGEVLIAQLSTADGTGFEGTMVLQYFSNGVVENTSVTFQHTFAEPCPWDVEPMGGDGIVGVTDLLVLLALWGTDPGAPPDFDGNGVVNVADLLDLLGHWGLCP